MKSTLPFVFPLAILLGLSAAGFSAEIKRGVLNVTSENAKELMASEDAFMIHIVGEIEPGDTAVLERECASYLEMERPIVVRLDIPGGDFKEAMKMGRFLRKMRAKAFVRGPASANAPTRCYGAGVLVLAGAPIRIYGWTTPEGRSVYLPNIALTRPELPEEIAAKLDADQLQLEYSKLIKEIRHYLTEVETPPELASSNMYVSMAYQLAPRMERVPKGEYDYLPSWENLGVDNMHYKVRGTRLLPDHIDTERPIEDYLPRTQRYIVNWLKGSCPEPLTDEEYKEILSTDASDSYRDTLIEKLSTHSACANVKLVEFQNLTLVGHYKSAGIDVVKLVREQREETEAYLKAHFPN